MTSNQKERGKENRKKITDLEHNKNVVIVTEIFEFHLHVTSQKLFLLFFLHLSKKAVDMTIPTKSDFIKMVEGNMDR